MCYVSNYARPLLRVDINWAMSTKIVKIKNDDGRCIHSYYIVLSHHVQIVFTPNFKVILKYDLRWTYKNGEYIFYNIRFFIYIILFLYVIFANTNYNISMSYISIISDNDSLQCVKPSIDFKF